MALYVPDTPLYFHYIFLRIIWGIQQFTTKNPEKTVLEKTLQGTVYADVTDLML